ncbi:hypothetical protein [Pseudomonas sp. MYb185]|uniref:hypothetical protein n=1 Tax=Pseudomonas sp. MYb185 TaxID=1848729 RepID=UPI0015ABABD9|nr:hypothetical protein [Pseudomonas sp. MYb185]
MSKTYRIVGWVFGVLMTSLAIGSMFNGTATSTLMLVLATALLLPPVRSAAFERTNIKIPGVARFFLVFALFAWATSFIPEPGERGASVASETEVRQAEEVKGSEKAGSEPVTPPAPTAPLKAPKQEREASTSLQEIKINRLAREKIKGIIKDPNSAQFRNQRGGCGEVNAKNSFGAYVGFKRFMVSGGDMVFIDGDPDLAAGAFDEAWSMLCGPSGELANVARK